MPSRCVIYTRVSTADQAGPGHHSLAAQEALCCRYAEGNGLQVVEVLRDEGYSGRTTSRPGLRRLLEYTGSRPTLRIQKILVQDTSRVGRDTTEYLLFRRQLRQRGIDLVAVTQPNIDASPEGRLVDTILAGINQYQSEEKGRRVTIAMHKKLEGGWWPAKAPLGYRNVVRDARHVIERDPERFPLIQLAFREYATGRDTQQELGQLLTEKGLRDRSGRPLSRTSLNKLLANRFYKGLLRWDGVEQIGRHEPATDRGTWERCQAVTAEHNRYASRQRKHIFLLAGLLECAACGNRLTRTVNRRKRKRYYHCASLARCREGYIPEGTIEEQVADRVQCIQLTDEFIERVVEKVREVFARRMALHERQIGVLLRRRTLTEQKRDATEQKLVAGILSDEAFRRLMTTITAELDEVSRALDELEATRRLDTDALREVLVLAQDIPKAYGGAHQP